ncbi:hypothetical protein RV12_GL001061 [Enterococcus quebecensis]|nr:hypothetical protein RV12_GL001061 [Enterococcus quebecensis]
MLQTKEVEAAVIGDDYPTKWKNLPLGGAIDDWRLYTRYCTSFVANRLSKVNKFDIRNGGLDWNANQWANNARRQGYRVDNTPKIGSVAQWTGKYHVAWVADIKGDQVQIEEYNNPAGSGTYKTRWINKNDPDAYIHFKDMAVTIPVPTGKTTVSKEGTMVTITSTFTGTSEQLAAIKKVEYPTWSHNNTANKIWHTAKKINSNTYQAQVDFSIYKQYGLYSTHSYVTMSDGRQSTFANNNGYTLNPPIFPEGTTTVELEGDVAVVTSIFAGTSQQLAAIKKVEYPTWSHNNSANKLWHTATKINETTYQARIALSTYKQYGLYSTHSYITNKDGYQKSFANNNGYTLNPPIFPEGTTTVELEGSTAVLTSTFTGTPEQLAAIKKVEYPTWSHNNTSNKVWHMATKINETTYQARVDLSTYNQYGLYSTHSYITNKDGYQKSFAKNNGYVLDPPAIPTGTTTVVLEGNIAVLTSTFTGTSEQLAAIKKVEYPTWSHNNTPNKIWHMATKINETTYQARIDLSVYDQYGLYSTHSYLTMNDGREISFAKNNGYVLDPPAIPTGTTTVVLEGNIAVLTSTFTGTSEQLAAIKKVEYPTWSHNNTPNKIWHMATKINETTYQARIDLSIYDQYGLYSTHSYLTMNDGREISFATNNGYTFEKPQ